MGSMSAMQAWLFVGSGPPDVAAAEEAHHNSLAMHPTTGAPYLAYQTYSYGGSEYILGNFTVMTFNGSAWSPVGPPPSFSVALPFVGGSTDNIYGRGCQLVLHPTTHEPYLAFRDSDKAGKATVMRFTGGTW